MFTNTDVLNLLKPIRKNPELFDPEHKKYESFFYEDKFWFMCVLCINGEALKFGAKEFKADKDLIRIANKHTRFFKSIEFIDADLKTDARFIASLIYENPRTIKFIDTSLLENERFIEQFNAEILCHLFTEEGPATYRNNKEFALKVIKRLQTGDFREQLKFMAEWMQDDPEIVLAAVKNYGANLQFASKRLRNDFEIVLQAVFQDGYALKYANPKLKRNKKIVESAFSSPYSCPSLSFVADELRQDEDIVRLAVIRDCRNLRFADSKFHSNKEILLLALQDTNCDFDSLNLMGTNLIDDLEFLAKAICINKDFWQYLPEKLKRKEALSRIRKMVSDGHHNWM